MTPPHPSDISSTNRTLILIVIGTIIGPALWLHSKRAAHLLQSPHLSTDTPPLVLRPLRLQTAFALLLCLCLPLELSLAWSQALQAAETSAAALDAAGTTLAPHSALASDIRNAKTTALAVVLPVVFFLVAPTLFVIRLYIPRHKTFPHSAWIAPLTWTAAAIPSAWAYRLSDLSTARTPAAAAAMRALVARELRLCVGFATALMVGGAVFWVESFARAWCMRYLGVQPGRHVRGWEDGEMEGRQRGDLWERFGGTVGVWV